MALFRSAGPSSIGSVSVMRYSFLEYLANPDTHEL